jgi:FkbH-like protein
LLKLNRSELNYRELVRKARHLSIEGCQKLRIALLADVSTQHIVPLLRVLFAANGIDAVIYEAGFDTIQVETYNPGSELYTFAPQIIVILQSVAKLRARYYDTSERAEFGRVQADDIENVWRTLQSRLPVPVIQTNFALPIERPYGNFGTKVPDDLQATVHDVNRELALRARQHASVFLCDIDQLASWIGRRQFFDERLWALAKSLCSLEALPEVAQSIVDIALATIGRAIKCVVLDLDNTLWGGVVGDDGLEGIGLGDLDDGNAFRFFQLFMRELWRRGILLAVCSKNNEETARRVFREHPDMVLREEHIAVFVANWDDKASNIAKIREKLNIGYDAMVFLDDNPFERNLVRQLIPQIIVPELPEDPGLYVRAVSELNLFESAGRSELDAQRTEMYQVQEKRSAEMQRFGDVKEYLRSLETVVFMRSFESRDLSRIAQLIQRSNQFNLTTRRYSESQCEAMMHDPQLITFSINVRDRFGDFGLIAVGVVRKCTGYLDIDTFLMSCRVLQRGVEQYAMNRIFEYAREGNFERVVGHFIPSAKNSMVEGFYRQFGFEQTGPATAEGVEWSLSTQRYSPQDVFITEAPTVATQGTS